MSPALFSAMLHFKSPGNEIPPERTVYNSSGKKSLQFHLAAHPYPQKEIIKVYAWRRFALGVCGNFFGSVMLFSGLLMLLLTFSDFHRAQKLPSNLTSSETIGFVSG